MNILTFILSIILGTVIFFVVNLKNGFRSGSLLLWIGCCLVTFLLLLLLGKVIKVILIIIIVILFIALIVKILTVKW